MNALTLVLLGIYATALILLSRSKPGRRPEYLLAGRRLTLPAFVATLVTTWYGGILGIGEYAWRHGISTWVVFGLPYYLAAILFAFLLTRKLRRTNAMSIPDLLQETYGRRAAVTGAWAVFGMTVPAAYLLMLAVLLTQVTSWPLWLSAVVAAAFSVIYVGMSGFESVVRTDALQFALMYGGFLILLPVALHHTGGLSGLWASVPAGHRAWDGGLGWQAIAVWYLIALQTMVEPAFYQRVFAARTPEIARRGVLLSVLCWMVFDFLTVFTGLAARVLLPHLDNPVAAFPALAKLLLPALPYALFMIGLFATVMSTLDSYLFLAAATVGHDLGRPGLSPREDRKRTRWGLVVSAALAVGAALAFGSVVKIWHDVGSVVTSALLLPVLSIHFPVRYRYSEGGAVAAMILAAAVATAWIAGRSHGVYPYGIEPMFPALAISATCLAVDIVRKTPAFSAEEGQR
ncbi:MAG: sodium:solute symporter family protein [Acidobacteria bacterium]|nr:sodium:solute symporter family protein [Acidobacteriota bacterium]